MSHDLISEVFLRSSGLQLKNYYVGAGFLTQTVWNHLCGFPLDYGINDIEDAINTWPTTATAIGMRIENNETKIYAPFGLHDLFRMVIRANKIQITKDIFEAKIAKWSAKWPSLTVIPWD